MHKHIFQRYCWHILGAVVLLIFLKAAIDMAWMLRFQWLRPLTWDSTIYIAMGRGLLNGLQPYKDLFENKPPGMFMITAAALWLGEDAAWLGPFQVISLLTLFGVVAIFPLRMGHIGARKPLTLLCCWTFAIVLTHYTADRSGATQTESYGAMFATAFAALLATKSDRPWNMQRALLGGLLAAGAVMMKEPFALTLVACCLVLTRTAKGFLRNAVVPGALCLLISMTLLASGGMLSDYVQIYVRDMLHNHIGSTGSPFERAFHVGQTWRNLLDFNPLFAVSILAVLLWNYIHGLFQHWAKALLHTITLSVAVYLVLFAIGLGGQFYGHHYVFAVPLYATLLFDVLRDLHQRPRFHLTKYHAAAFASLTTISLLLPLNKWDYAADLQAQVTQHGTAAAVAQQIDDVIEHCNLQTYLFLGQNGVQPYAYTKHSPMGPLFFQYPEYYQEGRDEFRSIVKNMLAQAQFVVEDRYNNQGTMQDYIRSTLTEQFTTKPWPCALEDVKPNSRFGFRFRKTSQ